jgi:hypothetical protein
MPDRDCASVDVQKFGLRGGHGSFFSVPGPFGTGPAATKVPGTLTFLAQIGIGEW